MRSTFLLLLSAIALSPFSLRAYTITTLQYPGASETYATGVNSSGVVVGTYYDSGGIAHGFIYTNGTYTAFSIPATSGTWITGINDAETIVGYFHGSNGETLSFTLSGTTVTPFYIRLAKETLALGINQAGESVGYSEPLGSSKAASGFTYAGGTFTTFKLSGQANTWLTGISRTGNRVVGYTGAALSSGTPVAAFVISGGTAVTFATAPGAVQTFLNGVNDLGAAVGYGITAAAAVNAFVYKGGSFTPFTIGGAITTIPNGISDAGVIVGSYTPTSDPNTVYGFIATP